MKLCFLLFPLLVAAVRGVDREASKVKNPDDFLRLDPTQGHGRPSFRGTTIMDAAQDSSSNNMAMLDQLDEVNIARRLGDDLLKKYQDGSPFASARPFGAPKAPVRDVFVGSSNEHEQCNFCGSTGTCGRTEPLGDSFSVTVDLEEEDKGIVIGLCVAPAMWDATCMYSPNNAPPNYIPQDEERLTYYGKCPRGQCCNYIYDRQRSSFTSLLGFPEACETSQCNFIERVCFDTSTTLTCPVGSQMLIVSFGSFDVSTSNGLIIDMTTDTCEGKRDSVECSDPTGDEASLLIATADDCTCVFCRGDEVQRKRCNVPVDSRWRAEGICNEDKKSGYCRKPNSPPIVEIVRPLQGQRFDDTQTIYIEGSISDDDGNEVGDRVAWFLDGTQQRVTSPSDIYIEAGLLLYGEHELRVVAYDIRGASSEDIVKFHVEEQKAGDNPPSVTILSPKRNERFDYSGPIPLVASATDPEDGNLDGEKVRWLVDGLELATGAEAEIPAEVLSCGSHTVLVVVTDSNGKTADARVEFFVWPDEPPECTIDATPDRKKFKEGETFELEAFFAVPPGRDIVVFDWFLNGELQAPTCREVVVNTTESSIGRGNHLVELQIADSQGERSKTCAFEFTVDLKTGNEPDLPQCPGNDREWYVTRNGRDRKCNWVKKNTKKRCNLKGVDDRRAYEACPRVCGNTGEWKRKVGKKEKGCLWVKRNPEKRCSKRGTGADRRPAFKACAVACCGYNRDKAGGAKELFGGGEEDYDPEDDYDDDEDDFGGEEDYYEDEGDYYNDDQDFGGSVDYRCSRRPFLGFPR